MSINKIVATLLFILTLHFLSPANVYAVDDPEVNINPRAGLQSHSTTLNYFIYDDARESDADWETMLFRAVSINDSLVYFIVSSELEPVDPFEGLGRYGGHRLFDDDTTTAWVEGVEGQGRGEYIIFSAGEPFPERLFIHNGYQKSDRLFKMNSRPRILNISLYAGFHLEGHDSEISSRFRLRPVTGTRVLELDDNMGPQSFDIPFDKGAALKAKDSLALLFADDYRQEIENLKAMCPTCDHTPRFSFFIKLEIGDAYQGSEWADNCISEITYSGSREDNMFRSRLEADSAHFVGEDERISGEDEGLAGEAERISGEDERLAGEDKKIASETGRKAIYPGPLEGKIINVYEDEDPDAGMIYVDTESRKGIILVDKKKLEENKEREGDGSLNIVLMDVSPGMEWALVDILFYPGGAGRVEEYSVLYNVRMLQRVDESILETGFGVFGFVEENGRIWLDTVDGFIDLDKIKDRMLEAGSQQLTEKSFISRSSMALRSPSPYSLP